MTETVGAHRRGGEFGFIITGKAEIGSHTVPGERGGEQFRFGVKAGQERLETRERFGHVAVGNGAIPCMKEHLLLRLTTHIRQALFYGERHVVPGGKFLPAG